MRNSFTSLAKTSCTSLTPLVHVQKLPTARDDACVYTCAWFYVDAGRHWQAASSHVNHVCATHEAVFYRGEDGQVREEDVGIEWPRARTDLEERGIIFLSSSFLLFFFFLAKEELEEFLFSGRSFCLEKLVEEGRNKVIWKLSASSRFRKHWGHLVEREGRKEARNIAAKVGSNKADECWARLECIPIARMHPL